MLFLEDLSNLTLQAGDISGIGTFFAWILAFVMILVVILIIFYIYSSLTLMIVAKRTKTKNAWFAWIPFLSFYLMSKIAKKHWWPVLLLIIPILFSFLTANSIISVIDTIALIVFTVFSTIWMWKICEIRNRPGWWAIIVLIPIIGFPIWWFIMWGILAWSKK